MQLFSKENKEVFTNPLNLDHPILVQVLGICSALAVTSQLKPAIVMGLAVTVITAFANVIISIIRNTIPTRIRIVVQLVVVAALVTIVSQVLKAFAYDVSVELSVYVGLIITNCILMGRLEAFAMTNRPWPSFIDGVSNGLGYAMIYMRDSSTGGSDFITMSIRVLNPHLTIGNITFAMDAFIVLLGTVLVSRDMDSLIYGVIVSYLMSIVVDKTMYGIDRGKVTLIVTEHGPEVCAKIDEILGRGSTILKGIGSYSKHQKDVVMCACNNKQMYGIRKLVKEIDKKAFLVIMESNEVVGEGFKEE